MTMETASAFGRSARVAVADLGIGNFAALAKMIARFGADVRRVDTPSGLSGATHVVLPGVGAFDYAVQTLDRGGWREPLMQVLANGDRPVLCVCVGMQLLAMDSQEGPGAGLGFLRARCVRFPDAADLKVPHMGWNTLDVVRPTGLFPANAEERFYFVHSYHLQCDDPDDVVATAHYGVDFPAVVAREHVTGVQFHPEKSHRFGLELIGRFLASRC